MPYSSINDGYSDALATPPTLELGYIRPTAHGLTALAIATVFTFAIPAQPNNRWFWHLLQWGGLASAAAAVVLYSKLEEEEERQQYSLDLQLQAAVAETTTRLKEHYETQLYQLQLQHQDAHQTLQQQYLLTRQQ